MRATIAFLLLVTLPLPNSAVLAQEPHFPDELVSAAVLAARSDGEALTCIPSARHLNADAIRKIKKFDAPDQRSYDTAGVLLTKLRVRGQELQNEEQQSRQLMRAADRAIRDHRLQDSDELLRAAASSSCTASFSKVEQRLQQRRAQADQLVREADLRASNDPKGARKRLERVRHSFDRQYAGLDQRISSAREAEQLRKRQFGWGGFWTVVVGVAAAGALGYLAAQQPLHTRY